jgi:hypothetical protein
MANSRSARILAMRSGLAVCALLVMLIAACNRSESSPADAAAHAAIDAPQSSLTTSTGTGSLTSTSTGPQTGRDTATETVTGSAGRTDTVTRTATATATATVTISASAQTTAVSTSPRIGPFTATATAIGTSKPTGSIWTSSTGTVFATGINTSANTFTRTTTTICYPAGETEVPAGTATSLGTSTSTGICATWSQIKVSRTSGLGFCPVAGSAESVMVKLADDGSLTLSGDAFDTAPRGDNQVCLGTAPSSQCWVKQPFPDMRLTPAQRDELMGLVAALPPGWCTPNGACDPCLRTTLTIDQFSNTDWVGCCYESSQPGTHMAGEHAIVSFIDSLIPKAPVVGVDASADGAQRDSRTDR